MRNSNVLAIAPTATISNIMGTTPCIEPTYKNLFVKSNLSGEFIVLNAVPRARSQGRGLWNQEMIDNLKYFDGDLDRHRRHPRRHQGPLPRPPSTSTTNAHHRRCRRPPPEVDRPVPVREPLPQEPRPQKRSRTCTAAPGTKGLKTTYYLRTLGASNIEKAKVPESDVKRRFSRSLTHFVKIYAPLSDGWTFRNNSVQPASLLFDSANSTLQQVKDFLSQ
jgi:ribonucleoside-diphosphate reductase alpha chain